MMMMMTMTINRKNEIEKLTSSGDRLRPRPSGTTPPTLDTGRTATSDTKLPPVPSDRSASSAESLSCVVVLCQSAECNNDHIQHV